MEVVLAPPKKATAKSKAMPKPVVKHEEECESLLEEEGEGEMRAVITPSAPDLSVSSPIAFSTTNVPLYPPLVRTEGPIPVSRVFEVLATQSSPSDMNNTMLHTASAPSMIPTLIEKNANVEATNDLGHTPFLHHVAAGRWDMCEALLKANADPHAVSHEGNNALHIVSNAALVPHLVKEGVDASALNIEFMSPLCCMAERGAFDCARALLNAKVKDGFAVDVYHRTKSGDTIFDFASENPVLMEELNGYVIQNFFLKNGPDVNKRDPLGRTALFYANPKDVEKWVNLGVNMSLKDFKNLTVLTFHASKGNVEHIMALIKCGAAASFSTIEDVRMFDGALKKYTKGATHRVFSALMDHMNEMSSLKKDLTQYNTWKEGDMLDAKDTANRWLVATVVKIDPTNSTRLFVHYEGWDDKWNEWFTVSSPRVAPIGTHTSSRFKFPLYLKDGDLLECNWKETWCVSKVAQVISEGQPRMLIRFGECEEWVSPPFDRLAPLGTHALKTGTMLDARKQSFEWCRAKVLTVDANRVHINYEGGNVRWNEWIPVSSERLAPLGTHTTANVTTTTTSSPSTAVFPFNLKEGDMVNARDTVGKWLVAKVLKVDPTTPPRMFIHYEGYGDKWNEWISLPSERLSQMDKQDPEDLTYPPPLDVPAVVPSASTKTSLNLYVGGYVDIKHGNTWFPGRVVQCKNGVVVAFGSPHSIRVSTSPDQLAAFGTKCTTRHLVDVKPYSDWRVGEVLQRENDEITVHCIGWQVTERIHFTNKLAPLGKYTKVNAPNAFCPGARDMVDVYRSGEWVGGMVIAAQAETWQYTVRLENGKKPTVTIAHLLPFRTHSRLPKKVSVGDKVDVRGEITNQWYFGFVTASNGNVCTVRNYAGFFEQDIPLTSPRLAVHGTCTKNSACSLA